MSNDTPILQGQTAWVTGSSRGLGRIMAEELVRLGANVAVHGTREDSPKTFGEGESMQQVADDVGQLGPGETMACWGDMTSESEVARAAGEIREKFGQIDILICCAGGDIGAGGTAVGRGGRPDNDDCLGISLPDLQSVMDRNLLTAMLCCREVAPEMIGRKSGRIVTIGSIAGMYGRENGSIYCVAKAGVHAWTRCLAAQLREHNVQVNCVAPGGTVTERFKRIHDYNKDWVIDEPTTLERYGWPEEIATVVGFLCTPASKFMSGQVLRVDGGGQTFPC